MKKHPLIFLLVLFVEELNCVSLTFGTKFIPLNTRERNYLPNCNNTSKYRNGVVHILKKIQVLKVCFYLRFIHGLFLRQGVEA